jgi:hypothetical protein
MVIFLYLLFWPDAGVAQQPRRVVHAFEDGCFHVCHFG